MFKQCLTLLAALTVFAPLQAQKGSWGELPMIPPKSFAAKKAAAAKISGTPAHEKALRVYERLREARGDFRNPVPEFYLTSNETVAEIFYEENAIYLGEKAFEVCETFGEQSESAIAFLLGHELSHYYEKHAWRKSFAYKNSDLGALTQLDTLYKSILGDVADPSLRGKLLRFDTLIHLWDKAQLEAQADYLGGFLAYTAGYGAFFRGDELIAKLYKAFGMPDQLDGYLSRNERQAFSKKAAQQLSDLVDIFEMANLLTAVGEYEEAYRFYRKVLTEYQSREVYNNVGAAATLHALKYFTAQELPYRYPVQLDLEMANSRGGEEIAIRKKLLEQAVQHFDAAISLDPGYAPALLNKACALALLGDGDRAYFYADVEARRASTGKYALNLTKIEIVLAILEAQSHKPDGKEKDGQTALRHLAHRPKRPRCLQPGHGER
jgi:Peptidase family M48.